MASNPRFWLQRNSLSGGMTEGDILQLIYRQYTTEQVNRNWQYDEKTHAWSRLVEMDRKIYVVVIHNRKMFEHLCIRFSFWSLVEEAPKWVMTETVQLQQEQGGWVVLNVQPPSSQKEGDLLYGEIIRQYQSFLEGMGCPFLSQILKGILGGLHRYLFQVMEIIEKTSNTKTPA